MQVVFHLDEANKRIAVIDSLLKKKQKAGKDVKKMLQVLQRWFHDELERVQESLSPARRDELEKLKAELTFSVNPPSIGSPQQGNGFDCGLYCALCIKHIAGKKILAYGPTDKQSASIHMRKLVALELLCGRLSPNERWGAK